MFPELEKFSGKPGLMANPIHEHELFHDGFEELTAYVANTKPAEYRWKGPGGMKSIIDSFSKPLTDHLYAEIDVFLALEGLDETGLRKIWAEAEKIAQQSSKLSEVIVRVHVSCRTRSDALSLQLLTCRDLAVRCLPSGAGMLGQDLRGRRGFPASAFRDALHGEVLVWCWERCVALSALRLLGQAATLGVRTGCEIVGRRMIMSRYCMPGLSRRLGLVSWIDGESWIRSRVIFSVRY